MMMPFANLTYTLGLAALLLFACPPFVWPFHVDTHETLSRLALRTTEPLSDEVMEGIGKRLSDAYGVDAGLDLIHEGQELRDWLVDGSAFEDNLVDGFMWWNPLSWWATARFLNHFHDPTCSWEHAGLGQRYVIPGTDEPVHPIGDSAILWGQDRRQRGAGGALADQRSWQHARESFHRALTEPDEDARTAAWADTFLTLGHQIHLVQDMASPAHTRNDPHMIKDVFHEWGIDVAGRSALAAYDQDLPALRQLVRLAVDPALTRHPSPSTAARVPIANLFDTSLGANPNPSVGLGLAEYSNANFLSDGASGLAEPNTLPSCGLYASPSVADAYPCPEPSRDPKTGKLRDYVCREIDGQAIVLGTREALLDPHTGALGAIADGGIDDNVVESYAKLLLPKAIGYSAALIDYFFRGEIGLEHDWQTRQGRLVRNLSDEAMKGEVKVYYEDIAGNRKAIPFEEPVEVDLQPGATHQLAFRDPDDADPTKLGQYMVVFVGTLGEEKPADEKFIGAVVGAAVDIGPRGPFCLPPLTSQDGPPGDEACYRTRNRIGTWPTTVPDVPVESSCSVGIESANTLQIDATLARSSTPANTEISLDCELITSSCYVTIPGRDRPPGGWWQSSTGLQTSIPWFAPTSEFPYRPNDMCMYEGGYIYLDTSEWDHFSDAAIRYWCTGESPALAYHAPDEASPAAITTPRSHWSESDDFLYLYVGGELHVWAPEDGKIADVAFSARASVGPVCVGAQADLVPEEMVYKPMYLDWKRYPEFWLPQE